MQNQQFDLARSLDSERRLIRPEIRTFGCQAEAVQMSSEIKQLLYLEELATLTLQYLELSLPLPAALRAAEADL